MTPFEKFLYLRKSRLPGAGKGLFTGKDIPGGKLIVEYKGRIRKWKEAKPEDGFNAYLFRLNRKEVVDAKNHLKALGRYANDARGFGKVKGIRNNSEYVVIKNKCYIKSIRRISKGEEILVPYGKAYWNLIKKISECNSSAHHK